jgi:hypothetical protein
LVRLQPIRHWNCWQWLWRCCKVNRWRQWRHLLLLLCVLKFEFNFTFELFFERYYITIYRYFYYESC